MQSRTVSRHTLLRAVGGICLAWACVGCGGDKPNPGLPKGTPPSDPAQNLDFNGLRGVLSGKWEKKNSSYMTIEFTKTTITGRHDFGICRYGGSILGISLQLSCLSSRCHIPTTTR